MTTKHHAYKGLFVGMHLCIGIGLCTDTDLFKLLFYVIYVIASVQPDRSCFMFEVWQVNTKKYCFWCACDIGAGIGSKLTVTRYQQYRWVTRNWCRYWSQPSVCDILLLNIVRGNCMKSAHCILQASVLSVLLGRQCIPGCSVQHHY